MEQEHEYGRAVREHEQDGAIRVEQKTFAFIATDGYCIDGDYLRTYDTLGVPGYCDARQAVSYYVTNGLQNGPYSMQPKPIWIEAHNIDDETERGRFEVIWKGIVDGYDIREIG